MSLYEDVDPKKYAMAQTERGRFLLEHPDEKMLFVIPEQERVSRGRYWDCPARSSFHLVVAANGSRVIRPAWVRSGMARW